MDSVFDKLGTIFTGKAHGLLNRAISNDPDALDQLLRELHQERTNLRSEQAKADARCAQLDRDHHSILQQLTTLNDQAAALITNAETKKAAGDAAEAQRFDALAAVVVAKIPQTETTEKDLAEQLTQAQAIAEQIRQGLRLFDTKINSVSDQLRRTKSLLAQSKAQQSAANALGHVQGLLGQAGDVDNYTKLAEEKAAVSQAHFDDAIGALRDPAQEALDQVDVESRMAAIRARVQGQLPAPTAG